MSAGLIYLSPATPLDLNVVEWHEEFCCPTNNCVLSLVLPANTLVLLWLRLPSKKLETENEAWSKNFNPARKYSTRTKSNY